MCTHRVSGECESSSESMKNERIVISRSNLIELHKVLEENELSCMDLLHVNTDGLILTKRKLGQGRV
uniref:Uncharacterized protein n=1 Tax=Salix viminalis TaxID=40686 RepID=A0A6N2L8K4_SALVM